MESTTFTVTPVADSQKAEVEILTTMNPSAGLKGVVERLLLGRLLAPVYQKELQLLEAVAQKRDSQYAV
jgi:hypothetical protein